MNILLVLNIFLHFYLSFNLTSLICELWGLEIACVDQKCAFELQRSKDFERKIKLN